MKPIAAVATALVMLASSAAAQTVIEPVASAPPGLFQAPSSTVSRVVPSLSGGLVTYAFQWPGVYFETAFRGTDLYFKVGKGDTILHVVVDGQPLTALVKPAPGLYRIGGLAAGAHTARIEVASESQSVIDHFDGFFLTAGDTAQTLPRRAREIEFIGDSHTVGYGNASPSRTCKGDQLFETTDDTRAFGPVTAKHYGADYQVNAISGRGIVRNYNGGGGDFLPVAYPYDLFDKSVMDADRMWQPAVVVIALGTNDFSTPLNPPEQWKTRSELQADYEKHYVGFLQTLRQKYPKTHFVIWSTDLPGGEVRPEAEKVVAQLRAAGEVRISYVPVANLSLTGCDYHPSVADDKVISDALIHAIDAVPGVWDPDGRPAK